MPWHGRRKSGCAKTSAGRQPARADEFLRAVAVRQNLVQQRRALDQAGFERAPFVRRHDERNRVELPGPFHAARVAIDIVGDALLMDKPLAGVPTLLEFCRAQALQRADQFRIVRARPAVSASNSSKAPGAAW